MIPENKQNAVAKALTTAFNVSKYESIEPLTRGLSGALVFKIIVQGIAYLLRVTTKPDGRDDPSYYFSCLQTAADAGLAPKVHYLSVKDKILITDFIVQQPFQVNEARVKMARIVRHLHTLPNFPTRINYVDTTNVFVQKFKASNILEKGLSEELFNLYALIEQVYPRNDQSNMVSCHNDLKPDNIIFDGVQPWLVDWEAAFINDRYVDLAAIGNFVIKNDQDEIELLEHYFEQKADDYKRARFFLMSQIVHMLGFTLCALISSEGKMINLELKRPSFNDFHDLLWNKEINLASNEEKMQYALVHLDEMLRNMRSERFKDSLNIVSKHHEEQKANVVY